MPHLAIRRSASAISEGHPRDKTAFTCEGLPPAMAAMDATTAWVNSDHELLPSSLVQFGIELQHLLIVRKPETAQKLFSVLQEMITSSLFDLVACHLPEFFLRNHQLVKLKNLARAHQVALVFITPQAERVLPSLFSLIIDCQRDFITIRRALHRPTPFTIEGGSLHAHLMSQFSGFPRLRLC
jgi:recombination protein RecA